MKYLLILLSSIFLVSAKAQDNNISIDKINGIYLAKSTYSNKANNAIAICKNSKTNKIKVAFVVLIKSQISDLNESRKKTTPEKWQPFEEEMIVSKYGSAGTIIYNDGEILTSYMKVEQNQKIYGAMILFGDDYYGSYIAEKIKDNFEIIDMKTKKVLEVCKSQ